MTICSTSMGGRWASPPAMKTQTRTNDWEVARWGVRGWMESAVVLCMWLECSAGRNGGSGLLNGSHQAPWPVWLSGAPSPAAG